MDFPVDEDLYELIGAEKNATVQEIKKAYRKKALSCHPDKHPDNPKAAELFHKLSRTLEILTDTSARAAYNKVVASREQAKLRVKEFDSKRKKLKEDLEAREEAHKRSLSSEYRAKTDEERFKAEVERLRKEASKQVEEEIALVKRKIAEQLRDSCQKPVEGSIACRVKIKWKVGSDDAPDRYDSDTLHRILSKYGDITALVVSSKRKGKAIVEFRNKSDAEMAVNTEIGFVENPLTLEKLWNTEERAGVPSRSKWDDSACWKPFANKNSQTHGLSGFGETMNQPRMSDADFERSVLSNLRRAEERKRET